MEGLSKKKKILIIGLSAVLTVVAIIIAVLLVGWFGVDTSVATPDEAEPTTVVTEATEPEGNTDPTLPDGTPYVVEHDWDTLKDVNEEIVGWINIPNTVINYPVLRHEGDGFGYQYYIHRNYDRSYLFAGSIFIDYRSTEGVDSRNIITHGHSMLNGTMYRALFNYGHYEGDLDFYKTAPTIFFDTPEGNEQWIIFSVFKTNTLQSQGDFFNYFHGEFSSDAQFMNYVYNVKARSLFDVPVPINEDDQLITLSTCSQEYSEFRTVVVARKIRPGESVKAYVDGTTLNENPLWPDIYYTDHNAAKPEITTFKTEYQAGNIDWYDGEGNLDGSEWLVTVEGNKTYTVTFLNYNGEILSTQNVAYGKSATPPPDPVRPDDEYYTYVFKGWQLDYSYVTRNMTIAPSFEPVLKEKYAQ